MALGRIRAAATVLVTLFGLSACTVVGYPSGGGREAPAPAPAFDPPPVASGPASEPAARPASSEEPTPALASGRTYEVFGERYTVLATADGYRERGVASWYGEPFHGRPTASGETFDMNAPSAAHRTLPLKTWVEVTNLANGRRLVVRVNDRGPFVHTDERIIDLSYAAARELGIIGPGTAPVEVRALSPGERRGR
jgi:peptidoglycan lytic transglycosylase